ncbi:MAG: LicD family protein [Lachnospiraceae bacterium]|nr:LicD family protein [Lachnospiraceae bacterium]
MSGISTNKHSVDFFRDEIRNGFYVPTAIKQAWAATLDVLAHIDDICRKHGIRYFADWGTFLGAVRHGGFVPWDDDLDICMLRDDYEKFRRVADSELPEGYVIHDYERQKDHWLFLARVVNSSKMCFEEEYLDSHYNFPWLAGVDIFIKDYLYNDDEKEISRDKDIMKLIAVADGIVSGELRMSSALLQIKEFEKKYSVQLSRIEDVHDLAVALYRLAEGRMSEVKPKDADRIGQIFPWVLKNGPSAAEDKELYLSQIRLPFEDTSIPVPASYNKVLGRRYHNYNEIHKVWTAHNYPFFEQQREEIEKLLGERFPGFYFESSMLVRNKTDNSRSFKETAKECLKELVLLLNEAKKLLKEGRLDEFFAKAMDSQQLAADLGTLMENVKGEERESTIRLTEALQDYCDAIWEESQEISGIINTEGYQDISTDRSDSGIADLLHNLDKDELPLSKAKLDKVSESVRENITDRKEILFLPLGYKEWKTLEPYYENLIKDGDNEADIFVVPLPLMKKSFTGKVSMSDEEIKRSVGIEGYPENIDYTDWFAYDPALHCPDEVYVQDVYDGANPFLTIPSAFYIRNLQKYAEKIIYIPIGDTSEFDSRDINDIYNMKHYVTAPGVIYSDKVLVQSENIKEQYINVLTEFAGEDTRSLWQERIGLKEDYLSAGGVRDNEDTSSSGDPSRSSKKKLLFCIGANELSENEDVLFDALTERFGILDAEGDGISVTIVLYPGNRESWREINDTLSEQIFELIDRFVAGGKCEELKLIPSEADKTVSGFDAYYGSSSPLVPAFIMQKKPVMLACYKI